MASITITQTDECMDSSRHDIDLKYWKANVALLASRLIHNSNPTTNVAQIQKKENQLPLKS